MTRINRMKLRLILNLTSTITSAMIVPIETFGIFNMRKTIALMQLKQLERLEPAGVKL